MDRWTRVAAWVAGCCAVSLIVVASAGIADAACGDFNADGSVGATDALGVLQTAVGTRTCDKVRCDVDGNGVVTGTDALVVLKTAVGETLTLSCPSVAITSIDQLPRATGPVSGGSDLAAFVTGSAFGAQAGINLAEMGEQTFDTSSSMAACEVGNATRSALNAASNGDQVLCYVQTTFASLENPAVDIYDGQFHTFALDFGTPPPGANPEDFGGPALIRMQLVRDGDTITDFEMFTCMDTDNGLVQDEYFHQSIDGPDFTSVTKGIRDRLGDRSYDEVRVGGSLNDAGRFVGQKLVDVAHDSTWDQGSGLGELGFVQHADSFSIDGWESGLWTNDFGTGSYGNQVHAEAELLDSNIPDAEYSLHNLAMGNGAANVRSTGNDANGSWEHAVVEGWNGDTTQVDPSAAADFIAAVTGVELVPLGDAVSVGFGPGESYDCSGAPEAVVPVDQPTLDVACSALSLGYDYVNCHEIIQPDGGGPDPGEFCPAPDYCGGCWDAQCPCTPDQAGCMDQCWDSQCGPPPCYGSDCPTNPCGPDLCGGCWNADCTCMPDEPGCVDQCWDPACGDPCFGPDCGGSIDPQCWDPNCTCSVEDPACVDLCWNPDCGEPCFGPDCQIACWDPNCTCNPEDPGCFDQCWNPTCGDPCFTAECLTACWNPGCDCDPDEPGCVAVCWNPDCGEPCDGVQCVSECWDATCTCDPVADAGCVDACWDLSCGTPCFGPYCKSCVGTDCY
jgi:hypothetical protein